MISSGQVTTSGGSVSSLCVIPPGPCLLALSSDPASAATAYVGIQVTGGTLSSSNGYPIASGGQMTLVGYPGARGGTLSVVAAGTASASVGWLISRG
jgi:hypothetical protein